MTLSDYQRDERAEGRQHLTDKAKDPAHEQVEDALELPTDTVAREVEARREVREFQHATSQNYRDFVELDKAE